MTCENGECEACRLAKMVHRQMVIIKDQREEIKKLRGDR